jgi:hypothetical protein
VLDKSSHLRCWRLKSADQLPTGLVLSEAPGPHLQVQAANKLKLNKAIYNNKEINKSKTNNIPNISIVLFVGSPPSVAAASSMVSVRWR